MKYDKLIRKYEKKMQDIRECACRSIDETMQSHNQAEGKTIRKEYLKEAKRTHPDKMVAQGGSNDSSNFVDCNKR